MRKTLFNSLRRLDILQEFLEDETVTEIMVNGPERIFLEREGRLIKSEKAFSSREKLEDVIQQIVSRVNRTVNEADPIADARLADGSRVNVALRAVALDGPRHHDPQIREKGVFPGTACEPWNPCPRSWRNF